MTGNFPTCSRCDGWGFWYPTSTNREINWDMAARVMPEEGVLGAPGFVTVLSMRQPVPLACPECGGRLGERSPKLMKAIRKKSPGTDTG